MSLLRAYHTGKVEPDEGTLFVFGDDIEGTPDALTTWATGPGARLFQVHYFGPLARDPLTRNGLVIYDRVTGVTVVTGS